MIFIQKVCTNRLYANALKMLILIHKSNTNYDLDDAEQIRTKTHSLHFFLRNCETISVGSDTLLQYCAVFNRNVYLQTSPIIDHDARKAAKHKMLTLGWVGDSGNGNKISEPFSHKTSLFKLLFKPLLEINHPLKLILIGIKKQSDIVQIKSYFKDRTNIELEIPTELNWKNDRWLYSDITKFDVGLSPMVNHEFNQAKSAFKAKQYLSCGVPVIASDVGENGEFVKNNFNGIICKNSEEIKAAIHRFIEMDDGEYSVYSANCLENKSEYSMENYCKRLLENHDCSG